MKTSELKQSKYLKKDDCGEDGILAIICNLKQENVAMENKPEELKWILYFDGNIKPLVLNATNTSLIEKALGSDETDDWIGKSIVLFNDENVSFGGEITGGVRCDVSRTKRYNSKAGLPKGAGTPAAPARTIAEMEDDIPF